MALTNTSKPDGILSAAYRPLVWKYTSSTSTIVRIIADVYIDSLYRGSIDVDPDIGETKKFAVDVSSIVQDYLTTPVPATAGASLTSTRLTDPGKRIQVKAFEVTESSGVLSTAWTEKDIGSSGSSLPDGTFSINATRKPEEGDSIISYALGHNVFNKGANRKFITRRPSGTKQIKADFYLHYYHNFNSDWSDIAVRVKQYDAAGTQLVMNTFAYSKIQQTRRDIIIPESLIEADAVKLEVYVEASLISTGLTFVQISPTYVYNLQERPCNTDHLTDIYWVNSLGGIDNYTFQGRAQKEISSSINTYRKPLPIDHAVTNFGEQIMTVQNQQAHTITSGAVKQDVMNWLMELYTHRTKAWVKTTDGFLPIIIEGGAATPSDSAEYPMQVTIKYRMANNQVAQRN